VNYPTEKKRVLSTSYHAGGAVLRVSEVVSAQPAGPDYDEGVFKLTLDSGKSIIGPEDFLDQQAPGWRTLL
jgi:hypothetical protein